MVLETSFGIDLVPHHEASLKVEFTVSRGSMAKTGIPRLFEGTFMFVKRSSTIGDSGGSSVVGIRYLSESSIAGS